MYLCAWYFLVPTLQRYNHFGNTQNIRGYILVLGGSNCYILNGYG
nr:MAG TPA: hypothetical protein [Caudoviricetes sp.]